MNNYLSLSGLFLIIGVALLGGGIVAFFQRRAQIGRSIITTGTVVELLPQRKSGDFLLKKSADGWKLERKYLYRPVVRFKTETGRTIKFAAGVASRPMPFQVGEQVKVIYQPDNPKKAQINRPLYLWFTVSMLLFFGLFMLVMGSIGILMG
jgi:hypothetical protein